MQKNYIVWFEEVGKDDVGLVGGKGANLGEMTTANFPIPYGFIVTAEAYFLFIKESKLENKIKNIVSVVNFENPNELKTASKQIQKLIIESPIPKLLTDQIVEHYDHLSLKEEEYFKKQLSTTHKIQNKVRSFYSAPIVAVRSSATAEDLPTASFAGQQDTYLNVQGEAHLLLKVRECWASLFNERAIYYRHEQGFDRFKVGLAAVVQRMVESEKSGIAFSIDPVSNDKTKIVIEAIYGLGEYIVQGKVTPDHYEVDKRSFVILQKQSNYQNLKFVKSGIQNREVKLSKQNGSRMKLTDEEITKVALLVKDIEKHYYFPQDIEWAVENNEVFIVQSRPITTTKNFGGRNSESTTQNNTPIVIGSPASPGIGVGPAQVIFSPNEIGKIRKGDILVAPQTDPDYVPAMRKASAIVTEKGGRTSHAAIVSRELGIPAVVGAAEATKIIKEGMIITVNGQTGEVFKGKVMELKMNIDKKSKVIERRLHTVTKLYTNLAEPEEAVRIAKMHVDGIGLLRAEFMIAEIGIHPKEFIRNKKQNLFIESLTRRLFTFVKAFAPRPVIYRATDFKTNEYRHLKGGEKYEPVEENPMIGFRGASRYLANPDVFNLELQALKNIWDAGYRNLHLMIPFVRVPWELIKIKEFVRASGLYNFPDFKLEIMVEVPSCALNLEEFIKLGIDGVSIGTNDLTMMLLGVDRDSAEVASIYDERTPVVKQVLEFIVKTCVKHGITSSICGQAASDYPDIVESLVKSGITSVSVNSDAITRTRELIHSIEQKQYGKN